MTSISNLCSTCNKIRLSCEFCRKYGNKGQYMYLEKALRNLKKKEKKIEDDTINHRQLQIYSNLLLRRL